MHEVFHPVDVILKKRNGRELSSAELRALVSAVVHTHTPGAIATISDAQIAAFLMAVFLQGLTAHELADLTQAMRFSGDVLALSDLGAYTVDKHSTGGVGDKSSLLLAPIVAAVSADRVRAGLPPIAVPMISGRSLGHTGGTLDKLETIPGFNTQLSLAEMSAVLRQAHAVLVGQTPTLVPADRVLYALRDHTGTVESPFLITASIMSKKLAEDLRGLVLDVKVGSGAFMPNYGASRHLAELMVATGELAGTRTVALLTSMDEPLGRFSGNWLEVRECVEIMQGHRHALSADLLELSLTLAGWMLFLASACASPTDGALLADEYLRNGEAYTAWLAMVEAQGGDTSVFTNPVQHHIARASRVVAAPHDGYLAGMDCREVGWAVQRLGAGRTHPGAPVSAAAGLEVHAKLGTFVRAGQPVFTLFAEDAALLDEPHAMLQETLSFAPTSHAPAPLIREVVQS